MSDHVHVERKGTTLHLTLDRPKQKNALTGEMYGALAHHLESANTDDTIASILLFGSTEVFSAGNDLREFAMNPNLDPDAPVIRFLRALVNCNKVLIAAVCGNAVGVGTTMLLHFDLVIAGRSAKFATPFARLGLVPEAASSVLLPRRVGSQLANRMLLFGETIDAETAHDYGLVAQVVDDADALRIATEAASRLDEMAPHALMTTKELGCAEERAATIATMEREEQAFRAALLGPEAKEAFTAFSEKRAPKFRG